jgi:hypothetical protein
MGASDNPGRYSFLAIKSLLSHNQPVIALGKRAGNVHGILIATDKQQFADIDTVTLYINPSHQRQYYDYILSLNPKRIIFNPGTENNELASLAKNNGIQVMDACTLVLLATGQF